MRIWLRPDRLAKLGLTPSDVMSAIKEQNLQAPAGPRRQARPRPEDQEFTYTVSAPGRLMTEEEFANIIIRETETARSIRVKDVGRVELGGAGLQLVRPPDGKAAGRHGGLPPARRQPDRGRRGHLQDPAEAKVYFPDDLDYDRLRHDARGRSRSRRSTTPSSRRSILVTLVVIVFLQNLRATIIPLLTIPVSILGTFMFFPLIGFSVNTLSLFGLVLAIGIVVDDAIVVVEAVMHHIEHGMTPREATSLAMKEVTAPVIGIALVLSAVFIPVASLGGLTGRLYQQFALTIAISVLISAFNALSLSPALAAMFLKPARSTRPTGLLGMFFGAFNKVFDVATKGYVASAACSCACRSSPSRSSWSWRSSPRS